MINNYFDNRLIDLSNEKKKDFKKSGQNSLASDS